MFLFICLFFCLADKKKSWYSIKVQYNWLISNREHVSDRSKMLILYILKKFVFLVRYILSMTVLALLAMAFTNLIPRH